MNSQEGAETGQTIPRDTTKWSDWIDPRLGKLGNNLDCFRSTVFHTNKGGSNQPMGSK
jgi:hypothetical protein